MESIVDDQIDMIIDTNNYDLAFTTIKEILSKQTPIYAKLPESFKSLINNTEISREEKTLIVDKFKTIFSYDIYLSDGRNDGSNLATLIGERKDTYKRIT